MRFVREQAILSESKNKLSYFGIFCLCIMSKIVSTVDKVLDVLLLFNPERSRLSIEEISQLLHTPKSTVYRYVRILSDKGFLEKSGTAHYQLGLAFIGLARTALSNNRDLRLVALPSMQRIAEQIGESVSLMRISKQQVVCIESIEGQQALRVTIEKGRIQPLHAGASSKILLAFHHDSRWQGLLQQPLQRFTETTITDMEALAAALQRVRQQGFAVSNGEIEVGARAVAVPVRDAHGEVIAALSIEAPHSRMDDATVERYVALLKAEADIIQRAAD